MSKERYEWKKKQTQTGNTKDKAQAGGSKQGMYRRTKYG